eukprot:323027-Rhodomonas_salina.1
MRGRRWGVGQSQKTDSHRATEPVRQRQTRTDKTERGQREIASQTDRPTDKQTETETETETETGRQKQRAVCVWTSEALALELLGVVGGEGLAGGGHVEVGEDGMAVHEAVPQLHERLPQRGRERGREGERERGR